MKILDLEIEKVRGIRDKLSLTPQRRKPRDPWPERDREKRSC